MGSFCVEGARVGPCVNGMPPTLFPDFTALIFVTTRSLCSWPHACAPSPDHFFSYCRTTCRKLSAALRHVARLYALPRHAVDLAANLDRRVGNSEEKRSSRPISIRSFGSW